MLRAMALQATIWNSVTGATQALFMLYALRVLGLGPGGIWRAAHASVASARCWARPPHPRRGTAARLRTDLHRAGPRRLPGYAPDRGGHPTPAGGAGAGRRRGVPRRRGHRGHPGAAPSLRQTITPAPLLARMLATYRLLAFGTVPLGSVLGGFLGVERSACAPPCSSPSPGWPPPSRSCSPRSAPCVRFPTPAPKGPSCDHDPHCPSALRSPGSSSTRTMPNATPRPARPRPDRPAQQGLHPAGVVPGGRGRRPTGRQCRAVDHAR